MHYQEGEHPHSDGGSSKGDALTHKTVLYCNNGKGEDQ